MPSFCSSIELVGVAAKSIGITAFISLFKNLNLLNNKLSVYSCWLGSIDKASSTIIPNAALCAKSFDSLYS